MNDDSKGSGPKAQIFELGGEELAVVAVPGPPARVPEGLTPSEREVLGLLLAGCSNRDIARRRGTAERTVANQVASIFRKAGVLSRPELAAWVRGE